MMVKTMVVVFVGSILACIVWFGIVKYDPTEEKRRADAWIRSTILECKESCRKLGYEFFVKDNYHPGCHCGGSTK